MRPEIAALKLSPLRVALAVLFKFEVLVPHLNQAAVGVELAPEKEPRRVAPSELTLVSGLTVVTEAVGSCPPPPQAVPLHLSKTTTTELVLPVALPTETLKKPFPEPTEVLLEGLADVP